MRRLIPASIAVAEPRIPTDKQERAVIGNDDGLFVGYEKTPAVFKRPHHDYNGALFSCGG